MIRAAPLRERLYSTRKYEQAVEDFTDGYGISKSAVSRELVAVVDGFRNTSSALSKTRLDLGTDTPDRIINFLDISQCASAFQSQPYPFIGPTPECPPLTPQTVCTADLRADIDGNGTVDAVDEASENTTALELYVNDDDDNHNDIPDMNEAPVAFENNLVELKLTARNCDPATSASAWWSISWQETVPPRVEVWLNPEKSDGAGGPGTPLVNGTQYAWPPPETAWVEPLDEFQDFDITFTVSDGSASVVAGTPPGPSTDGIKLSSQTATRFEINLRVVMLLEEGADPDDPPQYTGGTKLSRTEVKQLVQQLVDYGDRIAPGLKFVWDSNASNAVIALESACLKLMPWPLPVNTTLNCLGTFPGDNPRNAPMSFYVGQVTNQPPGLSSAQLNCAGTTPPSGQACGDRDYGCDVVPTPPYFCDGYKSGPCYVNIYFIGSDGLGQFGFAPFLGNQIVQTTTPAVFIGDGAINNSATNPKDPLTLSVRRTLEHEVGCHLLPRAYHTLLAGRTCPNDLCIDGGYRPCTPPGGVGPPFYADAIPSSVSVKTVANVSSCSVQP